MKPMSGTVKLDRKGRLVLPKKIREEARINVNTRLIARAKGEGQIEVLDPDILMMRAQAIAAKKLTSWREEAHEATKLLPELVKGNKDETP